MPDDISHILGAWHFDPNQPIVRIIRGGDGREKVQMRVDMGILQMEMSGRPDGQRLTAAIRSSMVTKSNNSQAYDASHSISAPFPARRGRCGQALARSANNQ